MQIYFISRASVATGWSIGPNRQAASGREVLRNILVYDSCTTLMGHKCKAR